MSSSILSPPSYLPKEGKKKKKKTYVLNRAALLGNGLLETVAVSLLV
jgi:hypothetical protein